MYDLMHSLCRVYGTDAVESLRKKYPTYDPPLQNLRRFSQNEVPGGIQSLPTSALASAEAMDLAAKLLVLDPAERISAEEALHHPFLKACWENVHTL